MITPDNATTEDHSINLPRKIIFAPSILWIYPAMAISLTFAKPHRSIVTLAQTELPNFTLITGLNGSGKTHLLQAIANGSVLVAGISNPQIEVRYLDWSSLVPQDQGSFQSAQLAQERDSLLNALDHSFQEHQHRIIMAARNAGVPDRLLHNAKALARQSIEQLTESLGDASRAGEAHRVIREESIAVSNQMRGQFGGNLSLMKQIDAFENFTKNPIALYDRIEFMKNGPVAWGQADLFQQSFSRLFVAYRDLFVRNKLQILALAEGDKRAKPMSDDEFVGQYNIPPWDFLNTTLRDAGLDFEIDPPDLYGMGSYQAKLRKKSSGAEIEFGGLSSGEKVLMSFANCLYYARDNRQISIFPKVLLLDEVDAPLHPSMSKILIRAITETLVGQFGISVLATTHSPSTVAVAPEDCVHVMRPDSPGVHKTSKGKALSLLTSGVPTLSVNFSGRRQVLVESETDSRVLDRVYQLAKPYLNSERSLIFLAVGPRTQIGDLNAGCGQVQRMVNLMAEAGNNSLLGLVDWDGENHSSERLKVLASGNRDGLENCILDPLVLACLVARDVRDRRERIGLSSEGGSFEIKQLDPKMLQSVIDLIECLVLDEASPTAARRQCRYAGGLSLNVRTDYLEMDDHDLEKKVYNAFPALRKYESRKGALLVYIAESVLPDFPEFIPADFLVTFRELLDVEL